MAKRGRPKNSGKSARAKPDKRTVREQGVAPKGSETAEARQISPKDFDTLLRRTTALKKQSKEISGEISAKVSTAVEVNYLDKPAFDMIRKLWGMSPQKRLTTLASFDYMRDLPFKDRLLDEDETGQGELTIPRQEAGEVDGEDAKPKPRARRQAGISGTELAEATAEPGSHLRAVPDAAVA